ncbi:glutaredoxin domain-containing protein [Gordonia sp. X0973]|uniref:glutaredoxin domain-containing protein n=1 Tax=Gordonia sp. X0973 TaxID=2742602 RepID=UPI003463CFA2
MPEAIEAILSVPETALDSDRIAKEDELAIADEVRNAIEEANQKAELKAAERALKAANIAEAFMNGAHVTVYSSRVSVNSHATLAKLDRDKIQYEEVSIEDDADARDYVMALGYFHTPVVVVGDHHWAGFQPDYLDALSLPNAQKDRPGIA